MEIGHVSASRENSTVWATAATPDHSMCQVSTTCLRRFLETASCRFTPNAAGKTYSSLAGNIQGCGNPRDVDTPAEGYAKAGRAHKLVSLPPRPHTTSSHVVSCSIASSNGNCCHGGSHVRRSIQLAPLEHSLSFQLNPP